jgi:hypothetical protein
MLASVDTMPAADAQIVDHLNDVAAGRVIGEFYRAGGDAALAIDAFAFDCFNDRS